VDKKFKPLLIIVFAIVIIAGGTVLRFTVFAKNTFAMKTPSGAVDLLKNGGKPSLDEQVFYNPNFVKASTAFQFDLLKAAALEDENTLLSPLSVGIALAMTANGAEGKTLGAFENVLGMSLGELNNFYGTAQKRFGRSEKPTILNLTNAVFFDRGRVNVSDDFVADCIRYFSGGFYNMDFSSPNSAKNINDWVRDNSKGKIPGMIEQIDPMQIMFLANAVYFDGKWATKFDKKDNYFRDFAAPSGNVKTEFMQKKIKCRYFCDYGDNGIAAAILPYKGGEYSFAAIMPDDNFNGWLNGFTAEDYFGIMNKTREDEIPVGLPKFEASFSYELTEALKMLGLAEAFDQHFADFTKVGTATDNIYLFDVPHKSYLKVDEEGSVAVAITMPSLWEKGISEGVVFDKPFLYAIIENKTNLPIFMGIMNNPNEK